MICFKDTRLESFEAIQCEFYTTPSFLLLKDGITNNITLPQRKDFSFDKHYLMRYFLFDKNNLHNLQAACKKYRQIKRRRILHNEREYKKLRVIYNMAKTNNWYAEQNDYNYLMRRAFERTNIITPVNRFFSKTYRVLSDYGQNIIKPLGYLIFILLLFTLIYMSIDIVNNQDSFFSNFSPNLLVSLKQIISPFQLLLSSSSEEFKSFNTIIKPLFAVLESLISSTLIALFLISLRWNFKRNSE